MNPTTAAPKSTIATRMFVLPVWYQFPCAIPVAGPLQPETDPSADRPRTRSSIGAPVGTNLGFGFPLRVASWSR